jgi:hypothetical protein
MLVVFRSTVNDTYDSRFFKFFIQYIHFPFQLTYFLTKLHNSIITIYLNDTSAKSHSDVFIIGSFFFFG